MFESDKIKGIIFDYGGTIDSNGMHWAEVIWMAYQAEEVPVSKEIFRNAYVHGERTLGKNPIVKPHHTFLDMLRLKTDIQIEWLKAGDFIPEAYATPGLKQRLADWCYAYARKSIDTARPILEALSQKYPLVLVSNFYGNIESVLKDFHLDTYFKSIVESAVVGIRKPDPAIFGPIDFLTINNSIETFPIIKVVLSLLPKRQDYFYDKKICTSTIRTTHIM